MNTGLTTDSALSPDGKLLAYASDRGGKGNLDIWVQQVAGGEALQLTHDSADESEPAFSPDGSQIAFRSEHDGGGIYVVPSLGGDARRIVDGGREPRFSPDGSQIAYWTGKSLNFVVNTPGVSRIYIIPSGGGDPLAIQPGFSWARQFRISPDGKQLLFLGVRDPDSLPDWWMAPVGRRGGENRRPGSLKAWGRLAAEAFFNPAAGPAKKPRAVRATLGDSTYLARRRAAGWPGQVSSRAVDLRHRNRNQPVPPPAQPAFSASSITSTCGLCRPTPSRQADRRPGPIRRIRHHFYPDFLRMARL
jgi:dipeptidyl aminopeptidase/acylaminoacyl peptidase